MLSRAVFRSLQTPALQRHPAALRIASSSTVWNRSMARHNRPGQNQHQNPKMPTDYSRPPGQSPISKPSGASTPLNSQQQNQRSAGQSNPSKKHEGFGNTASPEKNTAHGSTQFSSRPANPEAQTGKSSNVSGQEAEFDTSADPSANTIPKSPESANEPAEPQEPLGPLPDLTQGIPSTLEYETTGSTRSPLNLAESKQPDDGPSRGRPRGELPASAYVSSTERKRLQFANYMYALFAALSVAGTVYLGRNWESEEEEQAHKEAPSGWGVGLMWNRARSRLGDQLSYYHEPAFRKLLPDPDPMFERPYTLCLSMEDLLIRSEWSREHGWRMAKRPGVDYFLRYLSQYYELVIFTSQPWGIAEPVIRKLDPFHIVTWPLFREATLYENGEYVKDLSYLNRDLSKVILLDTVPSHAKNQPENAIILKKWEGDAQDKELVGLIPFLEYIHTMNYGDVRTAIKSFEGTHIPTEFSRRESIARKKFHEQLLEERKKAPKRSAVGLLSSALGIKHQPVMMDPTEQTPAEAFAQGKMLQDQARERGQKNYEALEKEIRENGEKWLKEEAAMEEKAKEEGMKAMKSGFTGYFGGGK